MTRYILKKPLLGTITLLLSVTLLSGCFEQTSTQKVLFKPVYENMRLNCESSFNTKNEQQIKNGELKKWQLGEGGVKKKWRCHIWMSQIDEFPHDYVPTVFDTHVADIEVDKKQVN